jgi:hypothetical protein
MRPTPRQRFALCLAPLAATMLLAGCATTPMAEVTRFSIGTPIPSDAIALVPAAGTDAGSLEFRNHAAIVARELDAVGLHPVGADGQSAYVGVLNVVQTTRLGPPKRSPFSIGIGGATGGGGGGVGGGVSFPVGKAPTSEIRINMIDLQIRRRSDSSMIWEGKVVQEIAADAPQAALTAAVPALAKAMLTGFPGKNAETFKVKTVK